MAACDRYIAATGRRISFEYALMSGINDADEIAQRARKAAARSALPCQYHPLQSSRRAEVRAADGCGNRALRGYPARGRNPDHGFAIHVVSRSTQPAVSFAPSMLREQGTPIVPIASAGCPPDREVANDNADENTTPPEDCELVLRGVTLCSGVVSRLRLIAWMNSSLACPFACHSEQGRRLCGGSCPPYSFP